MNDAFERFSDARASIVAISFVNPERLENYLAGKDWKFPVLTDHARRAYKTFGLESGRWNQLFTLNALGSYVKLLFAGRKFSIAREDVRQLGGDFILDSKANVAYEYRSADPADRPSIDELLEAIEQLAPSP